MIKSHGGSYWYVNGNISNKKPSDFDSLKVNVIASNGEIAEEYVDSSGANKPELYDKMIPVIYKDNNWVYANISTKWYDYDAKEWANVVVLNDGITKNVGNIINVVTDVAMMYVWIPRYKYTIFNGNNGSVSPQQINIEFEIGTNKTGTVTCTTQTSGNGSSSETCTTITNGVSPATGTSSASGTYTYEVSLGWLASTTGTIYGIYDMSSGSWEYVMGNMVNTSNQFYNSSAGFSTNPLSKYYDSYTYNTSPINYSRGRLGDDTKETLLDYGSYTEGWYDNNAYLPNSNLAWFGRGGHFIDGNDSGIFHFSSTIGDAGVRRTSRTVIVEK